MRTTRIITTVAFATILAACGSNATSGTPTTSTTTPARTTVTVTTPAGSSDSPTPTTEEPAVEEPQPGVADNDTTGGDSPSAQTGGDPDPGTVQGNMPQAGEDCGTPGSTSTDSAGNTLYCVDGVLSTNPDRPMSSGETQMMNLCADANPYVTPEQCAAQGYPYGG